MALVSITRAGYGFSPISDSMSMEQSLNNLKYVLEGLNKKGFKEIPKPQFGKILNHCFGRDDYNFKDCNETISIQETINTIHGI